MAKSLLNGWDYEKLAWELLRSFVGIDVLDDYQAQHGNITL